MDASIQTDYVDSEEILNHLIKQEEYYEKMRQTKARASIRKQYSFQDPDQIHRLADSTDVRMLESDLGKRGNPIPSTSKAKPQPQRQLTQQQSIFEEFADEVDSSPTAAKRRLDFRENNSHHNKESRSEQSLSDRICQVVWERKASAPTVRPFRRASSHHHHSHHHSPSLRRGTAPNVAPMRTYSTHRKEKPDLFGRSQSFKGSSSTGSFKNRISFRGDPLSRRASGDAVVTVSGNSDSPLASFRAKKSILSHRHHRSFNNYECCSNVEQSIEHNGQNNQNEFSSCHSSRQNLFSLAPLEEKKGDGGGYGAHLTISGKSHEDADGDDCEEGGMDRRMRRQISMTLSIPSREDSVRSQSSTNSLGLSTALPITSAASSYTSSSKHAAGHQMRQPSMEKFARSGSNPDVLNSGRYQLSRVKLSSSRSLVGSNSNVRSLAGSSINLEDKKQQILSQKHERNEKVAWVVHIGFSSLLILAITCIVVFLRLSSTMTSSVSKPLQDETLNASSSSSSSPNDFRVPRENTSYPFSMTDDDYVRKENENLLQSIQPQLNSHNATTTPQPSTNIQQVQDNSIANQDNGIADNDKSITSLQSGQSLTRRTLSASSSSSDNTHGGDGSDTDTQNSNNDTIHEHMAAVNLDKGAEVDDEKGGGGGGGGSPNRSNSNKNGDDSNISIMNSDISGSSNTNTNPSLNSNPIRPKRSKPKVKSDEDEQRPRNPKIHVSVLNEQKHSPTNVESPPVPPKTRHLESTLIRFLKSSAGQGMRRERRYLENESRKL